MGLQSLLAEDRGRPAGSEVAAFPGAGQTRYFPVHCRRDLRPVDTFDPPYLDANDGNPLPIKQPLTFAAGKTGG